MRRENRSRRLLRRRAAFSKLLSHGELDWQRTNLTYDSLIIAVAGFLLGLGLRAIEVEEDTLFVRRMTWRGIMDDVAHR